MHLGILENIEDFNRKTLAVPIPWEQVSPPKYIIHLLARKSRGPSTSWWL